MTIIQVNDQTFDQAVVKDVVLVDFYATWCGPCKMLAPVLQELDEEVGDEIRIVKVDIDESPVITSEYEIMSVPSLLVFVDGELKAKTAGYLPKEDLLDFINGAK